MLRRQAKKEIRAFRFLANSLGIFGRNLEFLRAAAERKKCSAEKKIALSENRRVKIMEKLKIIGVALVVSAAAYLIVAFVFHPLWPRLRPFDGLLNVNQLVSESGLSFPSKHAVFAFFIATFVFGFNKRAAYGLFILAILVCLGRVLVGVHYPLDVLVGAIFGAVMGCLAFKIYKKFS